MNIDNFDLEGIATQVVGAVVILLVTWILARVVKTVLTKGLGKVSFLQSRGEDGENLAASLGTIASLVIWLHGLIAILNVFQLTEVVAPLQNMLNQGLAVLPGIIGAALVFFVGYVLAKIVREIVEIALQSAGADHWLSQADASATTDTGGDNPAPMKLSKIAGQVVFALILIVISISALQVLGIRAISEPATEMLSLILNTLPLIIAAAILLGLGYLIARFVAPVLENALRGLGTDRSMNELGVTSGSTSASALISRGVQVAIMLFFAVAATRVLGFPEITRILETVLEIGGRVVFGGAVIAAGVLIATILSRLASGQTAVIIRYATIALFVAIGLQFMGLADMIITLAFGSIVIGGALAAAIAFGLGGRDAAARQLERMQSRQASSTTPTSPSAGTTPSYGSDPLG
ncbi:mechanosensitive ion channel [Nocardioides salsibiostraticola]